MGKMTGKAKKGPSKAAKLMRLRTGTKLNDKTVTGAMRPKRKEGGMSKNMIKSNKAYNKFVKKNGKQKW